MSKIRMNTVATVMPPAIMSVRFPAEEVVVADVEREIGKREVTCLQD